MRIVLIHGQNHKGSTYHISRILTDKIQGEKDMDRLSKGLIGKNSPHVGLKTRFILTGKTHNYKI